MSCTVCHHPQRQAIDLALLNRTATLAQLSRQHDLSQSALHRHKQHLLKKMHQTENRFQDILHQGYLFILNYFLEAIMHVTPKAIAEGNFRLLLQAARQATGIIKFMQKLDDSLDPHTVYRLLEAPQETEAGSLLPTDLKFFSGSKQALAASLFAACPEPGSEEAKGLDAGLEGGAALADLAGLDPELLQNLLADLSQSLGVSECSLPSGKREKGGKKAKKGYGSNDNIKQYREDSWCEKNLAKFPRNEKLTAVIPALQPGQPCLQGQSPSGTAPAAQKTPEGSGSWIEDLDEGRLDINLLHAIGAGRPVDPDLVKYARAA